MHHMSAKTKLATLRSLELSDQRLLSSVAKELGIPPVNCQAWTDSQVLLHWLISNRPVGNNFVDNYINRVQELLPSVS